MPLTEPIVFEPLFMERVWGGRHLETVFGKRLPTRGRIGESWEIVDREEAQSVVHTGTLRGKTLHELWTDHRAEVFGSSAPETPRFPLLFKLLDARERLSVQVHPPAAIAPELNGEPKTEMWFIVDNDGDGDVFAGLKKGVTREEFEGALHNGTVEEKIHRVPVKAGDAIFIPSGRVHAIGAGNVIVEVQQNSDTTYRVFDWNRIGLDGKPREMHIAESLRSIDFSDFEPELAERSGNLIIESDYFRVERVGFDGSAEALPPSEFAIFTCLRGAVECGSMQFGPGDFFFLPAAMENRELRSTKERTALLRTTIPTADLATAHRGSGFV
jgi:mannose-6-phosphate isomerase